MSYCETCICLQFSQYYENVEEAINCGCLPCEGELRHMVTQGKFWACHDREEERVICQGAVSYAKKLGIPVPDKANIGQLFDDDERGVDHGKIL